MEIIIFVCESHYNEIVNSSRKISIKKPLAEAKSIQSYCDIAECYLEPIGMLKIEI